MGDIIVHNGILTLSGCKPFTLPDTVTPDVAYALFASKPGEAGFIGELSMDLDPKEKTRLRNSCRRIGGKVWERYCSEALKWAGLTNLDNKWDLKAFFVVYSCEVHSHWANTVMITDKGVRFVTTPRGVFTFPEFEWQYEVNLMNHLVEHQDDFNNRIDELKKHVGAELVRKTLVVCDREGRVGRGQYVGLSSLECAQWKLPEGMSFVSEEA